MPPPRTRVALPLRPLLGHKENADVSPLGGSAKDLHLSPAIDGAPDHERNSGPPQSPGTDERLTGSKDPRDGCLNSPKP